MKQKHLTKISKEVKLSRKKFGLSQTDLSKIAGVSRKFISDLENEKQTLEIAKVFTVMDSLGIELAINGEQSLLNRAIVNVKAFHIKGQKKYQQ